MITNFIRFKGTDKSVVIRTKKAIVLESDDTEFVSVLDDSTGEVTQFRPVDILSIGSIDEVLIPKDHKKPKAKKLTPKGMKIE